MLRFFKWLFGIKPKYVAPKKIDPPEPLSFTPVLNKPKSPAPVLTEKRKVKPTNSNSDSSTLISSIDPFPAILAISALNVMSTESRTEDNNVVEEVKPVAEISSSNEISLSTYNSSPSYETSSSSSDSYSSDNSSSCDSGSCCGGCE